jgi:hypothetical protein
MVKKSEDQPPKHTPTDKDLQRLANPNPKADQDTSYQDNKGKQKDVDGKKNPVDNPKTAGRGRKVGR